MPDIIDEMSFTGLAPNALLFAWPRRCNNATFGDDIKKNVSGNFPTNMILFDLLTEISLEFKCGPEDLILRQGTRFIPVINNGYTL